ncbi:MAG: hypothetical protein IJT72_07135 [Lachnospiraceae bacterium]|nr:hypothetical protein [Lachnospiraceae bacterium]
MELNSLFKNFKGKSSKIITFILIGMLLLVIAMPVKSKGMWGGSRTGYENGVESNDSSEGEKSLNEYTSRADYYENKLKEILEKSYGKGSMNVMVSMKGKEGGTDYFSDNAYSDEYNVDGVLIVADVRSEDAANIAFAVCALFNLPAHKVAVLIKN